MNPSTVEALQAFIAFEKPVEEEDVPNALDGTYTEQQIQPPNTCIVEGCESDVQVQERDGAYLVRCYSNHYNEVAKEDRIRFRPDFKHIIQELAADLRFTVNEFDTTELPRYAVVSTVEGIDIALIYGPLRYEDAVKDILHKTIEEGRPCLILTPRESIGDIVKLQSVYGSGYLAYAAPFLQMADVQGIRDTLQSVVDFHQFNQEIIRERFGEDPDEFTLKANRNPSYILSELSQFKVLRANKEIRPGDGSRLEKISEAAFSHLFSVKPDYGGEDSIFQVEPDNLFYLHETGSHGPVDYQPILGIVDTKSGKTANFGQEKIEGKHTEYVKRARKYVFHGAAVAHVFVVLDVQGGQELAFYDRMKHHYEENMYMIVLTVDEFLLIMAAYLSATISNELKLQEGSFTRAIYPLFHRDTFNSDTYSHLHRLTRDVGRTKEDQNEYDRGYAERTGLLVITSEVVLEHLERVSKGEGEIEMMLNSYL